MVLMVGGGDPDLADGGDLGDKIRVVPAEEELGQREYQDTAVGAEHGLKLRKRVVFSDVGNNYDTIANYYDRIHHLFYGQAETNAQVELLGYVRPGDRLLIVGGGTGWILEKIGSIFPSGLEITYIESSARMMERTKTRKWGKNRVELVTSVVEEWKAVMEYDCILTGFFFDNFKEAHAAEIVRQLTPYLKQGGYWLEVDFYHPGRRGKVWQAILLYSMYLSARLICGVEAKRLPDMDRIFSEEGYKVLYTTFHYQRFIRSMVYRKFLADRTYS
jgi:ubiquinone/menaquinone biosynthesis C-methylase UbiE